MKRISLTTLLALLVTFGTLQAQTRTITIQEAIEIALENNFSLKQAQNDLNLAEKRITSEYLDFAPNVSGSINGSSNTGQQFVADRLSSGLNPFVSINSKSISGSARASITIFSGFENINSLRASQQSKISQQENLQRQRETVIFQTASNYLQVLLSKELLEIRQENLNTSQRVLEQTRAQVEVGSRPTVDLYNQEATVANNELLVTQQQNTLLLNKLALIRQLQIDPLAEYEFVVPDISEAQIGNTAGLTLRALVNEALMSRSDIRSTQANIESLRLQYQIAKGSLLPTVSANVGLSSRYSDQLRNPNPNNPQERLKVSFNDQFFDQQVNKSIGFSINVPIFQNWNRMQNIQSSQISLKNAELNLENTELQVVQEVTQSYNDFNSFVKELEASEKSLIASEKAFETQQERYNVGASTLIELSQAQASYVEAQSNYTQAQYRLIFQEKLLDFYLGKLSGDQVTF
ncbi:TolC family protein [Balneola sp. MJW-20]|uniref:TolC family protein n=1 Tax=Gracilimonas aurantiaca TaxID=3234185 RepID=UPI0034677096